MNDKIKKLQTVRRVTVIDNSGDANKAFNISAEAETTPGRLCNVHNGSVRNTEGEEIATFYRLGSDNLTVTFRQPAESDKAAVLSAVEGFIAEAETADWDEPNV